MVLTVGLPLGGRVAINPGRPLVEMAAGRRGARGGAQKMIESPPARPHTRALFWTESEYDADEERWVGKVKTAEPHELHRPYAAAAPASQPELQPSDPPASSPFRRTLGAGTHPSGLAVDSRNGFVYWTDRSDGTISRAGIDGQTPPQHLGDGLFGHTTNDGPLGIALDPLTETVMWSAAGHSKIRRADLDGGAIATVSGGDPESWSGSGPWGLALHLRAGCTGARVPLNVRRDEVLSGPSSGLGMVFWTTWGRVQCCELGSGRVHDVVRGLIDPQGLVLDADGEGGGRLFWTDAKAGVVQCSALDGSRVCDVATGLDEPYGLALGPTHLFWSDRRRGAIQSCCLRTGAVRDVVTGLAAPEGLALLNTAVAAPAGGGVVAPTAAAATAAAGRPRFERTPAAAPAAVARRVVGGARRKATAAAAGNPHAAAVERVAKETAERTGAADGKAPSKPPSTLDMLTFSDRQLEQLQKARAGAFAAAPPGSRNWSA